MLARQPKAGVALLAEGVPTPEHERQVHRQLGQRLAQLLGSRFVEDDEAICSDPTTFYHLPARTLVGSDHRQKLGIASLADFFGGLVTQPYMATKAISHPLPSGMSAPPDWEERFAALAAEALLDGATVFRTADAQVAGERLLLRGPLRIKPVRATAGRGQQVIDSVCQLQQGLAHLDEQEIATWGLVLEQNLTDVTTYSVGQVCVGGLTASYYGTQQLTQDHAGEEVYGGSQLTVARGGYQQLLALDMEPHTRQAIRMAQRYEAAAVQSFPGFIASRRNYDVVRGLDAKGRWRMGVLEQSWRAGGASSAEILALQAFAADPGLQQVFASTHERFDNSPVPDDAIVFYQGDDPTVGRVTKYARIHNP